MEAQKQGKPAVVLREAEAVGRRPEPRPRQGERGAASWPSGRAFARQPVVPCRSCFHELCCLYLTYLTVINHVESITYLYCRDYVIVTA